MNRNALSPKLLTVRNDITGVSMSFRVYPDGRVYVVRREGSRKINNESLRLRLFEKAFPKATEAATV